LASRAVAQKDADDAQTAFDQAQAAVDQTKKDYDDTSVRAEIAGRVGRARLELGARVTGPGDLLTTVEQVDPIYLNFSPSDQDILRWRRDAATGQLLLPRTMSVQVLVADSGKVALRNVVATSWDAGAWLIAAGLQAGDRVIVDGVQNAAPGAPVKAVAYQPPADSAARVP